VEHKIEKSAHSMQACALVRKRTQAGALVRGSPRHVKASSCPTPSVQFAIMLCPSAFRPRATSDKVLKLFFIL